MVLLDNTVFAVIGVEGHFIVNDTLNTFLGDVAVMLK